MCVLGQEACTWAGVCTWAGTYVYPGRHVYTWTDMCTFGWTCVHVQVCVCVHEQVCMCMKWKYVYSRAGCVYAAYMVAVTQRVLSGGTHIAEPMVLAALVPVPPVPRLRGVLPGTWHTRSPALSPAGRLLQGDMALTGMGSSPAPQSCSSDSGHDDPRGSWAAPLHLHCSTLAEERGFCRKLFQ